MVRSVGLLLRHLLLVRHHLLLLRALRVRVGAALVLAEFLLAHLEVLRVALEHLLELALEPLDEAVLGEIGMLHQLGARASLLRLVLRQARPHKREMRAHMRTRASGRATSRA
eukprot:506871-Pleurochrysis_carterae.AAC.1